MREKEIKKVKEREREIREKEIKKVKERERDKR